MVQGPDEPHPVEVRCKKMGRHKRIGKEWHIGEWQMAKFKYFLPSPIPWRPEKTNTQLGSG